MTTSAEPCKGLERGIADSHVPAENEKIRATIVY